MQRCHTWLAVSLPSLSSASIARDINIILTAASTHKHDATKATLLLSLADTCMLGYYALCRENPCARDYTEEGSSLLVLPVDPEAAKHEAPDLVSLDLSICSLGQVAVRVQG